MSDIKSLAELAVMRAKRQLTEEEFNEAKRLIQEQDRSSAKKAAEKDKPGFKRVLLAFAIVFGAVGILSVFSDKSSSGTSKSSNQSAAKSSEEAEKKRKGFHCLSSWDGSHRIFIQELTKTLRDPNSFEHAETKITPRDNDDQHTVLMQYRAKNGFGGMNLATAMATIRSSDCSIVTWDSITN